MKKEFSESELHILEQAKQILESKARNTISFTQTWLAKSYFETRLSTETITVFSIALLDSKHRLIECVDLFSGSLTSCRVYPREIIKLVLGYNAKAIVLGHNKPESTPTPSEDDKAITWKIRDSLKVIDVNLLDHIIVGDGGSESFVQNGLIDIHK